MSTEIDTRDTRGRVTTAADVKTAAEPPVSLLIVDDDPTASYSLWALLRGQPGIRVCSVARSADAVEAVARERPDVCLVSTAMGPRLTHRLAELRGGTRVLAYTDRRNPELDAAAVIAGADRVIWRYADPNGVALTIRNAAHSLLRDERSVRVGGLG